MSTTAMPPVAQAAAIINELRRQANDLVGTVNNVELKPFHANGLGKFPYYWQDPRTLGFSAKTYDWIKSAVQARDNADQPITLDGVFTNKYRQVLTEISFSLSSSDKVKLNDAQANATDQQMALLTAWKQATGSLPAGDSPINEIVKTIRTEWTTDPKTTLQDMRNSRNLPALLGNAPAYATSVIPVFVEYLNALTPVLPLMEQESYNNGVLQNLKDAIDTPSKANGGLDLDGSYVPAYPIATSLSSILNSVKNTDSAIELSMTVSKESSEEVKVSVKGGTSFTIPVLDFFTLGIGGSASYFKDTMVSHSSEITIDMKFDGVSLAEFGPMNFDVSAITGWLYADPIKQAVENGDQDVTGFKFAGSTPPEFSDLGSFGFVNAVAFSNYPTITITAKSSEFSAMKSEFDETTKVAVSFLGIPLGGNVSESYEKKDVSVDQSNGSVTVTLTPPANLVAGASVDAQGFVLGVQAEFPVK